MRNYIKLTNAWKQNNCQQMFQPGCLHECGRQCTAGTGKIRRSKCTQDIDKTNHFKTKRNQTMTNNQIYTLTASSPSHMVQILE